MYLVDEHHTYPKSTLFWHLSSRRLVGAPSYTCEAIHNDSHSVSVISIIRFLSIYYLVDDDITWNFVPVATWTAAEMNLAVISACLPCLRPIVNMICKGRSVPAPSDPRRIDPARNTWHRVSPESFNHGRHGFVKLDDEVSLEDFGSDKSWKPSIFEMQPPNSAMKNGQRASATSVPIEHMGWD